MTQREQFEKKKVFLWGLKEASKSLLKEFDKGDMHPDRRAKKQAKEQKETKKTVVKRSFTIGEDYGIEDIDFLNEEYKHLQNQMKTIKDKDEMNELYDKEEALLETLEGLEAMKELRDKQGINTDKLVKGGGINNEIDTDSDNEIEYKEKSIGKGFKKGSPEALAHAEKMRKALEAKKNPNKQPIVKKTTETKARVQKGSEQAKELGKRLAEAKKKKMEALKQAKDEEEAKKKPEENKTKGYLLDGQEIPRGRPYYYIGDIPKGFRMATMQEAIRNDKVSEYGKFQVDMNMYNYYRDYGILLNPDATDNEIRINLMVLKKKTLKAYEDIEIFESKLENDKYKDKWNEFKHKLERAKDERKTYNAMLNFYWKLHSKRHNKEYKKIKIEPPKKRDFIVNTEKPIYKPDEPIIDIRTGKPVEAMTMADLKKEVLQTFYIKGNEILLKTSYFDKDNKLKTSYAEKLFKKGYVLREKYYKDKDIEKYFYDEI
jgi:hypothetical protein